MDYFDSLHKVIHFPDGMFGIPEVDARAKASAENKVLYEIGYEIAKRGLNNRCCFELQKNYVNGWHEIQIHYDCYFHNISFVPLVYPELINYEDMKWTQLSKSAWQEIWRRVKRLFRKES